VTDQNGCSQELDVDFTNVDEEGGIGGTVWIDSIVGNNGVFDSFENTVGDENISVVVNLYDSNGAQLIATTITDSNGYYNFTGIQQGEYLIEIDVPSGYLVTEIPANNPGNGLINNIDPTTNRSESINYFGCGDYKQINAGFKRE